MNKLFKQAGRICLLLCLPFALRAQEKGIHFEHGLTFEAIKAKAKAEHKFIFMDCFTTWCGPCKIMANSVFTQDSVGAYFNAHFINVKMQIDSTKNDDEHVKLLYAEAARLRKDRATVPAFPTFLFYTPDGQLVHRHVGCMFPGGVFYAPGFIQVAGEALQPATQYYTLIDSFHRAPAAFKPADLLKMAGVADSSMDGKNRDLFMNAYLATQTNLLTPENLKVVYTYTHSSKDKTFSTLLQYHDKVDAVMGVDKTVQKLQDMAGTEFPVSHLPAEPDWKQYTADVEKTFTGFGVQVTGRQAIDYYLHAKDWHKADSSMQAYAKQYPTGLDSQEMLYVGDYIFNNSDDKGCLQTALDWCYQAKNRGNQFTDIPQALLLYKLGQQETAVKLLGGFLEKNKDGLSDGGIQETFRKMQHGEKIWEHQ